MGLQTVFLFIGGLALGLLITLSVMGHLGDGTEEAKSSMASGPSRSRDGYGKLEEVQPHFNGIVKGKGSRAESVATEDTESVHKVFKPLRAKMDEFEDIVLVKQKPVKLSPEDQEIHRLASETASQLLKLKGLKGKDSNVNVQEEQEQEQEAVSTDSLNPNNKMMRGNNKRGKRAREKNAERMVDDTPIGGGGGGGANRAERKERREKRKEAKEAKEAAQAATGAGGGGGWVPGKEGGLDKYKAAAEEVAKSFTDMGAVSVSSDSTESSSGKGKVGKVPVSTIKVRPVIDQSASISDDDFIQKDAVTYKKKDVVPLKPKAKPQREKEREVEVDFSSSSSGPSVPPPLVPYHKQAERDPIVPYAPSVRLLKSQGKKIPDMSLQKAKHEEENLKIHLCNSVFEAYSASYLTTRKHMLEVESEGYNLTWVNCEMASFIHMKDSRNFLKNPDGKGMIMQSLDVLDFSAIHLSAFERSSKKHKHSLWTSRADLKTAWHNIDPVKHAGIELEKINNPKKNGGRKIVYSEEAKRTVVVMPFLGGAMGAGHSELGNRFEYLKACFWSFHEFVPNIAMGVTRQEDVDWAMNESGLPFYDIILHETLPKSASLPVATTQQVKKRLISGAWDFDYVFFTESDQILISRSLQMMYDHLKIYPSRMMLPHRLMPYSNRVIQEVHNRTVDIMEGHVNRNDWMKQSCCMPRQNCGERKSWRSIKDDNVPIINYYGLYVPLGNVNFLDEKYRFCSLDSYTDICP